MIPIKSMSLHNTIIVAGKTLGPKIDMNDLTIKGIQMFRADDHYVIAFRGTGKFIEKSNVAEAEPIDVKDLGLAVDLGPEIKQTPIVTTHGSPIRKAIPHTAQVGDPTRGIK